MSRLDRIYQGTQGANTKQPISNVLGSCIPDFGHLRYHCTPAPVPSTPTVNHHSPYHGVLMTNAAHLFTTLAANTRHDGGHKNGAAEDPRGDGESDHDNGYDGDNEAGEYDSESDQDDGYDGDNEAEEYDSEDLGDTSDGDDNEFDTDDSDFGGD